MTRVRRSESSAPAEAWRVDADDDYYFPELGPSAQAIPVRPVRRRPPIDHQSFFEPPLSPRGPARLTSDDVSCYDVLRAAGVTFPRLGPRLQPPWHAHHAALPHDFETSAAADREDWQRLLCLSHLESEQAREVERWFAVPYGTLPRATLASSRYYRYMRVRLVAGLTAWLSAQPPTQLWHVTLVSQRFLAAEDQLDQPYWDAKRIKARWRKQLVEHGLSQNNGWILAGLHADCQRRATGGSEYQFHYHCIADDLMKATLERLAANKAYYGVTSGIPRPKRFERVTVVEGLATYLAKSFWTQRNPAEATRPEDRVRDGSRLDDEQQLQALRWFDRQSFGDMMFTHHCNLPRYVRARGW